MRTRSAVLTSGSPVVDPLPWQPAPPTIPGWLAHRPGSWDGRDSPQETGVIDGAVDVFALLDLVQGRAGDEPVLRADAASASPRDAAQRLLDLFLGWRTGEAILRQVDPAGNRSDWPRREPDSPLAGDRRQATAVDAPSPRFRA